MFSTRTTPRAALIAQLDKDLTARFDGPRNSCSLHTRFFHAHHPLLMPRFGVLPTARLGFWALLLVLMSFLAASASAANPQLTSGGTAVSFPATGTHTITVQGGYGWEVANPSGTVVATSSGMNGWTENSSGGGSSGSPVTFTLQAPAAATLGTGYELRHSIPVSGYPASAFFDVAAAPIPAAPTGLAATSGSQTVSLTWTATPNAASYSLYRGTSAGGESTTAIAAGVTSLSYSDAGLTNGTPYFYVIRAVSSGGTSPVSNEVSIAPKLTAPTSLTVKLGNGQLSLAWTAVGGTGITYQVFQGTTAGGENATPVASGLTTTAYTATGLSNGTPYYFVVKAVNNSLIGPASNEVSAAPIAPPNLVAGGPSVSFPAVGTDTTTSLSQNGGYGWEVASPAGVVIASNGQTGANGWTESSSGSPVTFTLQAPFAAVIGTGYELRHYISGPPGYPASAIFNVIAAPVPPAPTGLSATGTNQTVSLTWTATPGAAFYSIFRGTTASGESTTALASGLTTPSYVDSAVTNGTAYYYVVKAISSGGTGPASGEASATPNLTAPTGLSAKAGNRQVSLSWTAIGGSLSGVTYRVYQGTSAGAESPAPVVYGLTGTTATVSSLTNGTPYYFVVKAASGGLTGPASNEASAAPSGGPVLVAGGSAVSFPATGTDTTTSFGQGSGYGWEVANPSGTVVATSSGMNGWTESSSGGGSSGSPVTFTLQAPAAATLGTGYELRHSIPVSGYPASAFFSVVVPQTVATPTFSPNGGSFNGSLVVTISDTTPGTVLYYTLDGSAPTAASAPYTGPITLTGTATVKVFGKLAGYSDSPVAAAIFTVLSAPTVTLTAPAEGASIAAPGPVTLTATAASASATIVKVEFFHGVTKIGQATASPYTMSWANVVAGSYTLTAKATDSNGLQTVSSPVHLTVSGGGVQLTLTPAGQALGFELTTFANNFPNTGANGIGPLGMTVLGNSVLATDAFGNVRIFPTDTDGQSATSVPAQTYGAWNAFGTVLLNGNIYMAQQSSGNGSVVQLNADGTLNQTIVTNLGAAVGMQANPKTNHLFVSTGGNGTTIFDVDPAAKTATVWMSGLASPDGMALSADSSILYVALASGNNIVGYSTVDKSKVFDYSTLNGGTGLSQMDGIALGYGALTGKIFANANNGFVYQIDILTGASTIIASGGSRGDFVSVDLNGQGALLLTQTDRIMRLFPFPAAGTSTIGIKSLMLNPASVTGGYSSTATVTLTAAAPVGGLILQLSSSNAFANVLGTVTVPAGQTTVKFPVGTVSVAAITRTTIQAYVNGTYGSATLTINPASCTPAALASLALSAATASIGQTVTGTLTLAAPALSGGEVVNLLCDTPAALSLPASVTVSAGATTATFTATALPVTVSTPLNVNASYHGTGFSQPLTVAPASGGGIGTTPGGGPGGLDTGGMTLTPIAIARGFQLRTFATFPGYPTDAAVTSSGKVIVSAFSGYAVHLLPTDKDGQDGSTAVTLPYNAWAVATVDGNAIYSSYSGLSRLDQNGKVITNYAISGTYGVFDITVNPVNGHVIGDNLTDFDPLTLIARQIPGGSGDGVAVTADGQYVFLGSTGGASLPFGYSMLSGALIFPPAGVTGLQTGVDGIAAGAGTLAGKIYSNDNDGTIVEYDISTGQQVLIASGGTRGDLAKVDQTNGTFLLSQGGNGSNLPRLLRLIPPPGAAFGAPTGKIIVTRDDLLHRYAPFSVVSPTLSGQSAKPAAFDLVGFSGLLSQGNMQRAGQLAYTNDGTFDIQWGLTSAFSSGLSSLGAAQTSVNLAASDPYTYSVNWPVSGDFLAEVQGNLGADYTALLLDQVSSACGNYNIADQPHQSWPFQKNILTLLVSPNSALVLVPAGRCLDMTAPGSDVPDDNAHWDVVFNGAVVGSSGNPQGWDVEADHTLYGGLSVTVPAGSAASPTGSTLGGYEVRFLAQQPGETSGSAGFSVASADTTSRAAILRPLTLPTPGVTGAATLAGTVSLDAPAPAGGATVTLTSTDPQNAAISAPGYVVIAAGATTSAPFTITTQGVSTLERVQIQASYNGYRTVSLVLRDTGGVVPKAPALTAAGGNNSVSLSWTAVPGATSYTLLRGTKRGGPYSSLFAGATGTQYLDKGVTNGTTYYYVVTASNDYGTGPQSNEASAAPSGGAVAQPTFASIPTGFSAPGSIQAILLDATPLAVIHYTLDGSTPGKSSPVYSGPITLLATTTVQAFAERAGYQTSTVASQQYSITNPISIKIDLNFPCGGITPTTSLSTADGWSKVQGPSFYGHDYTFTGTAGATITLTTHGTDTLPLDTVLFLLDPSGKVVASNDDGPNPPDAQITFTLPASGTYTAEVSTYKPGATGSYTLTLACVAAGAPKLAVVNGAAAQASGSTLAFGPVVVGNSASQTLTLKNTGTTELDFSQLQVPAGFTLTQAPANPVQPGMSTTLILSFAPASVQAFSGLLTLSSNDPASPYTLTLTGTGTSGSTGGAVALASLGLAPDPVIGGLGSVGTVILTSAAPAGGFQVNLSSGPPSLATVQASVTVPQGENFKTFPISTTAVLVRTDVPISATAGGATAPGVLTLLPQTAAPLPLISPPTRTFSSLNPLPAVQIADALPGAVITYTVDGSDPTSSPTRQTYASALTVTTTTTVRAAATAPGYLPSSIASATYTLLLSPTVALTAPITGSQLTAGVPVTVTATASAPSGTIAKVVFYAGATVIGQATSSPYSIVWPGGTAGQTIALTAVATDSNGLSGTSALVTVSFVAPPAGPALMSLSLIPDPVVGGQVVTGTVTLTGAAASIGAQVALTTTDAAHAPVLVFVTVPPGQITTTFTIATTAVAAQVVPTIGASYGGATATETLVINPVGTPSGLILSTLQLFPNPVTGGQTVTGTVTISAVAPLGGASVTLTTSDTAQTYSGLPSPSPVVVQPGATTATFTLTTKVVSSPQTVTVSASYGGATATGGLVINPGAVVVPLSCGQTISDALTQSDGVSLNPAFAGSGTHYARRYTFTPAVSGNYIVLLTTSAFDPALSLITAAGYTAPSSGQAVYALTAGTPYAFEVSTGASGQTGAFTLRLTCPSGSGPAVLSVTSGGASVPNDVPLTGPAFSFGSTPQGVPLMRTFTLTNSGGTDLAINSVVLTGDFGIVGTTPSLVPAGGQATLTLQFNATGLGAAAGTVAISSSAATSTYQFRVSATATAAAAVPTVVSVTPTPVPVTGGSPQTETVTLSSAAPSGGLSVSLKSSNPGVASVPDSLPFAPGKTAANFTVTTVSVSAAVPVTLTATLGTSSASAALTVNPSGTPPAITLAVGPALTAVAPGSFTLTPNVTPAAGTTTAKVEFYAGTTKIGETTGTAFSWTNVPAGSYALSAKVTDSRGLTATSSSVSVTVTAPVAGLTVVISPNASGVQFSAATTVTLSAQSGGSVVAGAQIYYTLDGSLWKPYTQPLLLVQTTTVMAKAVAVGYANSPVAQATFNFNAVSGGSFGVEILSPADSLGQTSAVAISAPAAITAGISAASSWQLSYQLDGDTAWVPFASGTNTAPVSGGTLATWDTTLLVNGLYLVQLAAVDTAGHASSAQIEVLVQGGQKVGYFTLSYNDLTVPVAGFPLSITRTYDSRVKTPGDFGVGWTLSTNNIRLQKSFGAIGDNWQQQQLPGLIPSFYISPLPGYPHTVSLTFPDGQVYSFAAVLGNGLSNPFMGEPIIGDTLHWIEQSGPKGASLTPVNANPQVYASDTSGRISLFNEDDSGGSTGSFDCNEFVLTTRDGRQFDVVAGSKAQGGGLRSVRDLNGNTLTFTANGITSSSGPAITFQRTGLNGPYITGISVSISVPNGQPILGPAITYGQDSNGDLKSVTDRASNISTYDYDPTHLLTGLHDPRGLVPLRNYYDGNGRLLYSLDGNDKKIQYAYDPNMLLPGNHVETTTDRLLNQTVLTYDGYGNVVGTLRYLKKADGSTDHTITMASAYGRPDLPDKRTQDVDALGRQTDYVYDDAGNIQTVSRYHSLADQVNKVNPVTTTVTYNSFGQPLTMSDPLGRVVSKNNYDAQGNLKWTRDALDHETDFDYNVNGTLAKTTDAKSNVTRFGYGDPNNTANVTSVTDAQQHTTTFTYDFDGNTKTRSITRNNAQGQPEALLTQFSYDNDDRIILAVAPDQATSQTFYTSFGRIDYTLDPVGRKTTYHYDNLGQMTGVTYPDGTSTATTYDLNGQVIASTDKAGRMSVSIYDSLGRTVISGPVSVPYTGTGTPAWLTDTATPAHALVSTMVYDDAGQVISQQDAMLHGGSTTYDNLGRTATSTDALSHTTTYQHDDAGRQLSVTDANQHTTSYDHDLSGRLTVTHYPDKSISSTDYDELGRCIKQTDQAGHATRYDYDTLGRLFTVTDSMNHVTTFGYDALGEKISQQDANGHTTYFGYDNRGRLVSKTLPGGQSDGRTYDGLGRLSTMTDFMGKVTTFAYEPLSGRLISKTASIGGTSTGESVSFTYNLLDGSRKSATRTLPGGTSITTTYAYYGYDASGNPVNGVSTSDFRQGQLQSVTTNGRKISYDYDVLGNKISMTTPGGSKVGYVYDILNRLQTVTHPDNAVTMFGYDKVGNRQSVSRTNAAGSVFSTTGYTYDSLNRLTDIANKNGSNGMVSSYHYGLRLDGKRSSVGESGPATSNATTNYFYDDQGKLTEEAGPYADIKYGYDNVGNRLTRTVTGAATGSGTTLVNGSTINTYDNNDHIATVNGSITHTYDLDGNETTVNGQTASYDFENHLVSLASIANSTILASYIYDADGNRVSTYVSSNTPTTTSYVVDTSLPYASVVEEYNGTNTVPSARYDYGDDLVRMDRGGVYYYIYDGLGSTRQLVSTMGAVTDSYGYSAFGELASRTSTQTVPTINPFLFNAQQLDQASGDYYLRARYYDQTSGRFISQDPFGGRNQDPISLHRYLYTGNDPVNSIDPGGQEGELVGTLNALIGQMTLVSARLAPLFRVLGYVNLAVDSFKLASDYRTTGSINWADVGWLSLDIVTLGRGKGLSQAPYAVLDRIIGGSELAKVGTRVTLPLYKAVESILKSKGVTLAIADEFLDADRSEAAFMPLGLGFPAVLIRREATVYQLLHECMHVLQYVQEGPENYLRMEWIEREWFVVKKMKEFSKFLDPKELVDVEELFEEYKGEYQRQKEYAGAWTGFPAFN